MVLQLSSRFRCDDSDPPGPTLHVRADTLARDAVMAVVDAVAWAGTIGASRVRVAYDRVTPEIAEPAATLVGALQGSISVDLVSVPAGAGFKPPNFSSARADWHAAIRSRANAVLPVLADQLSRAVARDEFRWYRTVTGKHWSGRVDGLEVCTVDGDAGHLDVGKVGKNGAESTARQEFRNIANGRQGPFRAKDVKRAASLVRDLVHSRVSGALRNEQREHHFESRVLRGAVRVNVPPLLVPVCPNLPFQFPTLWSCDGRARYVDALLRAGHVPWVAELKLYQPGQYLRHAIGQAVLYREFIRQAQKLHPWFRLEGLDPQACEAVVVVEGNPPPQELQFLLNLGAHFGVKTV